MGDTRERVRRILMEELSSQSDVDGMAICDRLLYLLDGINTNTDDPMANPPTSPPGKFDIDDEFTTSTTTNPPTNIKIRPTSKKKKKKKQQKKAAPPKTRSP